jgi:hypothetical protein
MLVGSGEYLPITCQVHQGSEPDEAPNHAVGLLGSTTSDRVGSRGSVILLMSYVVAGCRLGR